MNMNKFKIFKILDDTNSRIYAFQIGDGWIKYKLSKSGPTWVVDANRMRDALKNGFDAIANDALGFSIEARNFLNLNDVYSVVGFGQLCTIEPFVSAVQRIFEVGSAMNQMQSGLDEDSMMRRDVESSMFSAYDAYGSDVDVRTSQMKSVMFNGNRVIVYVDREMQQIIPLVGPIMAWSSRVPDENPPDQDDPMSPIS